jgi:hypothetical protein
MPRKKNAVPSYQLHKSTGQAFVKVPDGAGGRTFIYLGKHGTDESRKEYERVLAELRVGSREAQSGKPGSAWRRSWPRSSVMPRNTTAGPTEPPRVSWASSNRSPASCFAFTGTGPPRSLARWR